MTQLVEPLRLQLKYEPLVALAGEHQSYRESKIMLQGAFKSYAIISLLAHHTNFVYDILSLWQEEKICQLGARSFIANSLIGPSFVFSAVGGPRASKKSHNGNLQYQSQICVKCFVCLLLGGRLLFMSGAPFLAPANWPQIFTSCNIIWIINMHLNALAKRFKGVALTFPCALDRNDTFLLCNPKKNATKKRQQ